MQRGRRAIGDDFMFDLIMLLLLASFIAGPAGFAAVCARL